MTEDFDFLPVRDGVATGHANENRMLGKANRAGGVDGFTTVIQPFTAPDGSQGEVMLRTRGGRPEFTTKVEQSSDEPALSCPLKDHGLVDCYYNELGLYNEAIYNAETPLSRLVNQDGLVIEAAHLASDSATLEKLHNSMASMFSGHMRRIVQLDRGRSKAGGAFEFSPNWGFTHGLWLNAAGKRYLLEVTSSTVSRRDLTFCKDLPADWEAVDVGLAASLPPEEFAEQIAPYWTVTKVGPKITIATFPTVEGSPFYSWCGWAFNYAGTKACIVTNSTKDFEQQWNRLYEITIADDGTKPVSAECALVSEDWFINRDLRDDEQNLVSGGNTGCLQIPVDPGKCATHSYWSRWASPSRDLAAPVFAYYEKTGNRHVVNFTSPYRPNATSDDGKALKSTQGVSVELGYAIDFGSANQVSMPRDVFPRTPVGPYFTDELGTRTVSDKRYNKAGYFTSPLLSAPGHLWETEVRDITSYEESGSGGITSVDLNSGGLMVKRIYIMHAYTTAIDTHYWSYIQYVDENIMQGIGYKQVNSVAKHDTIERRINPFLVLHGWDRESYAIGCVSYEATHTDTRTTENIGEYRKIDGENVCARMGNQGRQTTADGWVEMTIVGATDVATTQYPQFHPWVTSGPTTFESSDTDSNSLVSKLVVGSDSYPMTTSGFGQFGPVAADYLHFRAAKSAFQDELLRNLELETSPVKTTCGDYITTMATNCFVGVI